MLRAFEFAVLAAIALPAIRAALSSGYRTVFPLEAMRMGAASLIYLAILSTVALFAAQSLHVLSVFALAFGVWLLWRSRPQYGVASGLPPGSLTPLPLRTWSDPDFYKREAARYGNVFKTSQFGRPMVCIVGLDRANKLLLDHDEHLTAPPLPFSKFIEGGYLRYLPEETHANYRRFFRSLFHSEVVGNAEPEITAIFNRGLRRMCADSSQHGQARVKPAIMRMMFAAWAELFYGIGEEHPDFPRLKELFHIIDIRRARWTPRRKVESALAEIETMLRRRSDALIKNDAAPSCFLALLARNNPEALADRTVLGNFIYIMHVTWGDVTGLLTWIFKMLSDHREWFDQLALNPTRDLATRIVRETLRLEQSESRYRRAATDLEVDGFRIPKNWLVRMCIRESHQNAATFPNPESFDPDRFLGKTFTRSEYAPFGAFRLACIGEELTKVVGALFALELARSFDWDVVADGPSEMTTWTHIAPSRRFAVSMSATAAAH